MKNSENTLLDYRKIETETRARAKQIGLMYATNVPQASWLKLDIDGAVLMTPAEFFQLPQSARDFFLDGNAVHYRNDRIAMRGERTILLDGYYSGGARGGQRVDYFLETAQSYRWVVPELIEGLSDDTAGQWKAKLAVWDNLIILGVAQFHALKAITLLYKFPTKDRIETTGKSQQLMSNMFNGYFLQLCGYPSTELAGGCSNDILSMMNFVNSYKEEFRRWGEYDLFRTERVEVASAQALMAAYSWVQEGLLDNLE